MSRSGAPADALAAAWPARRARRGQPSLGLGARAAAAAPRSRAEGPRSPRPLQRHSGTEASASRTPGPRTGRRDGSARAPSVKQQVRPCAGFWHSTGPAVQVHDQIAGLLCRPCPVRVPVTPRMCALRVATSITNSTCSRLRKTVPTVKKSHASRPVTWRAGTSARRGVQVVRSGSAAPGAENPTKGHRADLVAEAGQFAVHPAASAAPRPPGGAPATRHPPTAPSAPVAPSTRPRERTSGKHE